MSLFAILGPNFADKFREANDEAVNGLMSEDEFFADVHPDDMPPPVSVGVFDDVPMPRDPYGCVNPVSQIEEE